MANKRKAKGSAGELEMCRIIEEELALPPKTVARNLEQARDGSSDIVLYGCMIEVKRHETLEVSAWWRQVVKSALKHNSFPVLAYRQNRRPWMFCIPSSLILKGDWRYITLSREVFFDWFRHRVGLAQSNKIAVK